MSSVIVTYMRVLQKKLVSNNKQQNKEKIADGHNQLLKKGKKRNVTILVIFSYGDPFKIESKTLI